jgi:SpoVK/Ycf46/Vps4 family AAA+-type ATPase
VGELGEQIVKPYQTSLQHLLAEIARIDVLIRRQVWWTRHTQGPEDEFRGLYISEREIDALVTPPPAQLDPQAASHLAEFQHALEQHCAEIAQRKAVSEQAGLVLRLERLRLLFGLTSFDIDTVLLCLAPEIDLRYERLYAYLHDDVNKKSPTVDLALRLLCSSPDEKITRRQHFLLTAPLRTAQLVDLVDDMAQPHTPLPRRTLKIDERIVAYLFGGDEPSARVLPYLRALTPQRHLEGLSLPSELRQRLVALLNTPSQPHAGMVFFLQGPPGVGKRKLAEAVCRQRGIELVVVDGERLLSASEITFSMGVTLVVREARLRDAAIFWRGFDALAGDDKRPQREILLHALHTWQGISFLAGTLPWEPGNVRRTVPFFPILYPRSSAAQREQEWQHALTAELPHEGDVDLSAVANKFRLTSGQIHEAATTARDLARWRDPKHPRITMGDLATASRLHSNHKLATLARKITPHYTWDDIVLPPDRFQQLREICAAVRHRVLVYEQWGFDGKLSLGKGLNVLFAGPSGTGKTMAAELIAGEMQLDLYKIDVSTVVSKYIGETEKNLSRIFAEAETGNAILFFDEADALFGKRSEVRDAHDRYANIEISYLLQKMEEYEGVVILATNLRNNMDEAFVRRMHYTLDFPFPNEDDRCRIWRKLWPAQTPRADNLDFEFLARRFELAGGNIRNIVLAAAFLAADDGQVVAMSHLLHATRREHQKMGKMVTDRDFGE